MISLKIEIKTNFVAMMLLWYLKQSFEKLLFSQLLEEWRYSEKDRGPNEPKKEETPRVENLANDARELAEKMERQKKQLSAQRDRLNWGTEGVGKSESSEVKTPLEWNKVQEILWKVSQWPNSVAVSDKTKADIAKSFEEKPFDTVNKTEKEIQEEVEARAIELKVKEMKARELSPAKGETPAQSEADYIKELEKKYWLSEDSLTSIRARNQTWIGSDIDKDTNQSWKITDPESYKSKMEKLAQNAKKAQEYAKANEALLNAWNDTIAANVAAILEGKDPANLSEAEQKAYTQKAHKDMQQGDGASSLNRLLWKGMKWFDSNGGGGNVNLDPKQLTNLPPTNPEKAENLWKLFGSAIEKYGKQYDIPQEWANDSNLHKVVMKESGWIVGRLNYCFWPVAQRMGTNINDPKFITFVHQKLQAGASAWDFWIRSVASWVGQMIKANVVKYYPDQLKGIWNADSECIGMLRYIKERYQTPANVVAKYGQSHEGY